MKNLILIFLITLFPLCSAAQVKRITCPICKEKFLSQAALEQHKASAHAKPQKQKPQTAAKTFRCKACGQTFTSKKLLKQHQKNECSGPVENSDRHIVEPARNATVKPQNNEVLKRLEQNMVLVDGGTFFMGAIDGDANSRSDEAPAHAVTLTPFYIGKYEVTQEEWIAVMGSNPSEHVGMKLPVENVSWNDCQTFIQRLNKLTGHTYSLPTEAQWEYAARGGKHQGETLYAGSAILNDVGWHHGNAFDATHEVGQKAPNELGLYDMTGNVWEWCKDWYDENYYNAAPTTNPQGPQSGTYRVNRGGGWQQFSKRCRVTFRDSDEPQSKNGVLGLRLAMNLQP